MENEIVISGISGRFPESNSTEEFWENLMNGVDMVTTNDRRWPVGFLGIPQRKGTLKADLTKFDASFFGVFPNQAERVDPQIRQLLEVTYEAILDSGVNPTAIRGQNIGVYIGASAHDTFEACRKHPDIVSGYDITGSSCCMLANRLSYAFDFHGPSFCIDTFCSSSLMALHQGMAAIRAGECDAAIISGVNLLMNPMTSLQILGVGALAPDGKCKVFDAAGNGFVRSEAIVSLFIQKKNVARRSYGTLLHSKTNTDGFKTKGVSYPSGAVQQKLMEATYAESGVNPLDVFYVEPHGTGTEAGDPQEVNAITEVFTKGRNGEKPLLMGATKSNMGHAEPAAALCAVTKVALALQKRLFPANLHFNTPNPNIPAIQDGRIQIVTKTTPIPPENNLVAVNSTGLGGSNIHVILRGSEDVKTNSKLPSAPVLIPFSGRTEEAVQYALDKIIATPRDTEFEGLLHKISEHPTAGHRYRGFTVLGTEAEPTVHIQSVPVERPPLWFVFAGMGTLWRGMTKDLMEFEMFSESIHKSCEILKPLGMDLLDILLNGDDEILSRHMGTCFVAMGVAFIDMLAAVGIKPDGFVGHSAGELMCGYIDGCISQRDALICYFFKDECVLKCNNGAMAAIGLSWEEAHKQCPPGIYPACHNGETNVTVSGPAADVAQFVKDLTAKGVFAREVATGGVAYHSPYLSPIMPTFEAHTRALVVKDKPRSKHWISSSRPEADWDKHMGNGDYVVNNMKSPVLFHGAVKHIPANAVVLEVSAHSIFISVLKKSLPSTCNIMGLIRKGSGNNAGQFLSAIGKLYEFGYDINIAALYPQIKFPVTVGTPMISTLVQWDHSETYSLPDYLFNSSGAGESGVEVSLSKETDSYMAGHTIDGRILFPATGYLAMVWKKFASLQGKPYGKLPVVFENVRFERATMLPKEGTVKFQIGIAERTGDFQISEGGSVIVSGVVKCAGETIPALSEQEMAAVLKEDTKNVPLTTDDIYKELRLQGYEYHGLFKGLKHVDNDGKWARISWEDNWVAFLDTMLQFPIVCKESRGLYLPTKLQRAVINPEAFCNMINNNSSLSTEGIPVTYCNKFDILKCHGVEIKGLKTSVAPRRTHNQSPVLEEAKITPYVDLSQKHAEEDILKFFVDVIIENVPSFRFNVKEEVTTLKENLSNTIQNYVKEMPLRHAELTVLSEDADSEVKDKLDAEGITVTKKGKEDATFNVVVTDSSSALSEVKTALKDEGLVLLKSSVALPAAVNYPEINLVAERKSETHFFYLFKKESSKALKSDYVLNIDDADFKWLPALKEAMQKSSTDKDFSRIYLTSVGTPKSGIVGLVKCLRQESGGHKVRCVFSATPIELTKKTDPVVKNILSNDLVMNVVDKTGVLSSYRHFSLKPEALSVHQTPYAYINVENRGDLSSLKFIEAPSPLLHLGAKGEQDLCQVYYAPLNFRDVMLATGKLPPDALPGKLATQECILGLEFVGKDKTGKRVMGMVEAKGLATHVLADPLFMWDVPAQWSMEEAATVPVAYSTAYYSLIIRGRMKAGESVLIHSGSGGVGQAAIAIALSMNCRVFTTVGSAEKKEFLKKQFPKLTEESFANSRDTTFEEHVIYHTEGRGVDLVLNSLSEEKLQASVRCLAEGGRFLEIGKYDLSKNNALGMAIFLKNVTFHGILLDALFEKSSDDKREVVRLVSEGMKTGTVRPLPRSLFNTNEIEEAFRFMANGKHMGKVVLKIKDEKEAADKVTLVNASPRAHFDPARVYVLVGGLGGFGLELAGWLVQRGAKKVVLVSRSNVKNGYQSLSLRRWQAQGVQVSVVHSDVTTLKGATELLQTASKLGPIGGIFNLAMVLKDGFIENQTAENFVAVTKPKVDTTIHLDAVSRQLCPDLEYFVVFSSAACGHGNAGQTNYGLANSVMERICEQRKADKLSGLAIQWGAIGDVGVIQDHMGGNDVVLGGTVPQRLSSCLHVLDSFLRKTELTVVASTVLPESSGNKSSAEKLSLLTSVAKILGIKNVASVTNKSITLGELGIDSLMAVELKQILEWYCELTLSTAEIRELSWEKLEELDGKK